MKLKNFFWVLGLAFLALGFFIYSPLQNKNPAEKKVPLKKITLEFSQRIEKSNLESARKIYQQKIEAYYLSTQKRFQGRKVRAISSQPPQENIRFDQEDLAAKINRQLDREDKPSNEYGVEQRLLASQAREEWADSYDEDYKRQFIQELKRKARNDGWKILINDKLEIIRVQKTN